jgi:hypothetical protein
MKKTAIASLFLSALSLMPAITSADPIGIRVLVNCPSPENELSRFANYIGGYGVEFIESHDNRIYFKSNSLSSRVPENLSNYRNAGVTYGVSTGVVTCNYRSVNPEEGDFALTYQLVNAQGGSAVSQGDKQIIISLPIGLH